MQFIADKCRGCKNPLTKIGLMQNFRFIPSSFHHGYFAGHGGEINPAIRGDRRGVIAAGGIQALLEVERLTGLGIE